MGDVIATIASLEVSADRSDPDLLFLLTPEAVHRQVPIYIACRPKGESRRMGGRPEWEYEEKDGRLHLTPSLLCTDTGFHTDYHWSVAYVICPQGSNGVTHCLDLNPSAVLDPPRTSAPPREPAA